MDYDKQLPFNEHKNVYSYNLNIDRKFIINEEIKKTHWTNEKRNKPIETHKTSL